MNSFIFQETSVKPLSVGEKNKKIPMVETSLDNNLLIIENAHPRIHKTIQNNWGTELLHLQLSKMVTLDAENREGFSAAVGHALMAIHLQHMHVFNFEPVWNLPTMKRDIW